MFAAARSRPTLRKTATRARGSQQQILARNDRRTSCTVITVITLIMILFPLEEFISVKNSFFFFSALKQKTTQTKNIEFGFLSDHIVEFSKS